MSQQTWQTYRLHVVIATLALIFVFTAYHGYQWTDPYLKVEVTTSDMKVFSKEIRKIFKPLIASPTAPYLDKEDNKVYGIAEPIWTSLGSEVCIADIDTRPFNEAGQLMSDDFGWEATDELSTGLLNHFLYAAMHGYSYRFINAEPWPNNERANSWTRVVHIRRLLDVCRFVVVVDNDAVFQHPELPLEWLLNRWNFTKEHSMAMPYDTAMWVNDEGEKLLDIPEMHDSHGALTINDGVIIAQSNARTKEMVDAWEACPADEARFPGCSKLANKWPNDQGAFSEYIRNAFDRPTDFKHISCDDANGFPGQHMNCSGTFLRHYTTNKPAVKANAGNILLEAFTSVFASHLGKFKAG